jgi:AcrR family transcriptional regulator
MSRTVDETLRDDLLERIVEYVWENGISDLQLRPLAKAVGSSPRGLLYHFGSKEELVTAALARAGVRQREVFETLPRNPESYAETVRAAWAVMSSPKNEGLFRLFFEIYGLALQDRDRFPGFLERAVEVWLSYLERPALRDGYSRADARAIATVLLAGYRGFLLDLCTTRDRKRLARAVELWILALEAIPPAKSIGHGR